MDLSTAASVEVNSLLVWCFHWRSSFSTYQSSGDVLQDHFIALMVVRTAANKAKPIVLETNHVAAPTTIAALM